MEPDTVEIDEHHSSQESLDSDDSNMVTNDAMEGNDAPVEDSPASRERTGVSRQPRRGYTNIMEPDTVEIDEHHSSQESLESDDSNMVTNDAMEGNDAPVEYSSAPIEGRSDSRQPRRVHSLRNHWRKPLSHNPYRRRQLMRQRNGTSLRSHADELSARVTQCRALASQMSAEANLYRATTCLIQADTMQVMVHTLHTVLENVQRYISHRRSIN